MRLPKGKNVFCRLWGEVPSFQGRGGLSSGEGESATEKADEREL